MGKGPSSEGPALEWWYVKFYATTVLSMLINKHIKYD